MLNYLYTTVIRLIEFKYTFKMHESDGCFIPRYRIFESFERYQSKKSLSIEKSNFITQNVSIALYFHKGNYQSIHCQTISKWNNNHTQAEIRFSYLHSFAYIDDKISMSFDSNNIIMLKRLAKEIKWNIWKRTIKFCTSGNRERHQKITFYV